MPPPRLFHPHALAAGATAKLDAAQAQYISRSLRLRTGDALTLFDGGGAEYPATVIDIGRDRATVQTGNAVVRSAESPLSIHLLQGLSKGDRMDFVIQKSTELGVTRLTPVFTEYSVVKLSGERASRRRDHWQRIAQSACEQCGRNIVPQIDAPVRLIDVMQQQLTSSDTRLILQPDSSATLAAVQRDADRLTLLIGPEGGFSDDELERAQIAGFQPVTLGPRILRTETAAVAILASAQSLWGDLAG